MPSAGSGSCRELSAQSLPERPIETRCQDQAARISERIRQWGDFAPDQITDPPDESKPVGPIVERAIQIEQEGRAGFEFPNASIQPTLSVRHMVENSQRVAEIEAVVLHTQAVDTGVMKPDIAHAREIPPGNIQSNATCINAVQHTYPRSDEPAPSTRAAADVYTYCSGRNTLPWKQPEVGENVTLLILREFALIDASPLITEAWTTDGSKFPSEEAAAN